MQLKIGYLFQCPPLYIAWNFKAFALTGRQACGHDYPGCYPGLGASALSGRVECSCKLEYIKLWIYK